MDREFRRLIIVDPWIRNFAGEGELELPSAGSRCGGSGGEERGHRTE